MTDRRTGRLRSYCGTSPKPVDSLLLHQAVETMILTWGAFLALLFLGAMIVWLVALVMIRVHLSDD